jgi:hypothetical protein
MVGDAGCFLDPIFSTGVTLAMMGAVEAVKHTAAILRNQVAPASARRQYCKFVTGSTSVFWGLIKSYYNHSFRELFMNGSGPLQVHNAVISILAGHVFPRPPFALRWRLWFFHACVQVQKWIAIVPRRKPFSLVQTPAELPPTLAESLQAALEAPAA